MASPAHSLNRQKTTRHRSFSAILSSCLPLRTRSMAESKKNGGGSSSNQNSRLRGPRVISKILGLASQVQDISKDFEGLEQYEQLIETQRALKKELEEKRVQVMQRDNQIKKMGVEIEDKKRECDTLLNSFGEKFRLLDRNETHIGVLEEQTASLKNELERVRGEVQRMSTAEADLRGKVDRQEKNLRKAKEQIAKQSQTCLDHKRMLDSKDIEIHQLEASCQELKQDASDGVLQHMSTLEMGRCADDLSNELHGMVLHYLLDAKDMSKTALNSLASHKSHTLKLSHGMTKYARLLRCAAAEAVVCDSLMRHVFRDLFYPATPSFSDATTAILDLLGGNPDAASSTASSLSDSVGGSSHKACRRQRVVRANLIAHQDSAYPDAGSVHKEVVTIVLDEVISLLQPFLVATAISEFRLKLEDFILHATQFWARVQRNTNRCTALGSMERAGDWEECEDQQADYHSLIEKTAELEVIRDQKLKTGEMEVVAVLFPQVICEGNCIFNGRALFNTHRAVLKASMERSHELASTKVPIHPHKRRSSVVSASTVTGMLGGGAGGGGGSSHSHPHNTGANLESAMPLSSPSSSSPRKMANLSPSRSTGRKIAAPGEQRPRGINSTTQDATSLATHRKPVSSTTGGKGNARPSAM
ncbi:hypothetical protein MKZ38_004904 [Zalerion maritima]|uniref:Uncharacterized protein n=1 Tax=Zalerion maritima TaxID=339359 RepID=A0AAD5RYC8_9PEZI|nr:hypothetical protein MKZ38_004904 [Zalerion maritima]